MRYLVFVIFSICQVYAQEVHNIKGNVVDEQGIDILVGDILLLQGEQKNMVKYTTISEGFFVLEDVPSGVYLIQVSALGFEPYQTEFSLEEPKEFSITLAEATVNLDEVEVTVTQNPIQYEAGNLKVNVQTPFFSSIPDPVDLLSRLPNVQVSADRESITILGKGNPLIYLGPQRISMEEFNALAIDAIETIELINNPSAKYEAEGRAVLLVTLVNNQNPGFSGSLQETASARQNFNNYLGFNSSYAGKRWTIRGNLAYNKLQQWESNSFLFEIPEQEVLVDYTVLIPKNQRVQLNGGLGLYLQWNDSDYISLNSTIRSQTDDAPFFTDTLIEEGANSDFINTNTRNDNTKDYYSASVNFNKGLEKDWNLFSGLQYSGFRQTLASEIRNSVDGAEFELDQIRDQEYSINSFALRLDAEKAFSENIKWESGVNVSLAKADAFTEIQNVTGGENSLIDFSYNEELYAGYSSLSGKIAETTDFELGLRVEHNTVDSAAATEDVPVVSRINTNLFPKANVTFTLDSVQSLNLNYARSIQRPDFSRASSIRAFINPFLEGSGNVNLRPTFTNELGINFQKGNKSFYARYYKSTNPSNFTISYNEQDETAILSLVNLEKESGFIIGTNLPFSKGIWTSNNTLSLNYNQIQDSMGSFSAAKPYLYAYTNHQFKIAKDTTLVAGAYALGKRQEGIFNRNGLAVFEASISKTFFENWDCTLRFNDITRAMNFEERYALAGVIADGVYFADAREVALSLKYRFGSREKITFKNRDVDENLDRIN